MLLLAAMTALSPEAPSAAAQGMRDPTFRGVRRAAILAQYGPSGEIAGGEDSDRLCAEVLALARAGAPVPLVCARIGDRVLGAPGTLAVIVQASVTRVGTTPLFAVVARTQWDGGLEPAGPGFGAAPRVAVYADTPAGRAARTRALDGVLGDVLPWRRGNAHQTDRYNRE